MRCTYMTRANFVWYRTSVRLAKGLICLKVCNNAFKSVSDKCTVLEQCSVETFAMFLFS